MSDPLLSSLCTICHVKSYKYRCPRCSALTCSLPCIKRHKQWAQCNGLRDPTVYVKQKDLATPKGIDHDYNYLTSIERELDHAEREATSRGVVLAEPSDRKTNKKKGEASMEAAFEKCGAVVIKAPKGMSRSKQNETSLTKKKRKLHWTVEWIDPDGRKALGKCPEDQLIADAYAAHLRTLDIHRPNKRREGNTSNSDNSQLGIPIYHNTSPRREQPASNIGQDNFPEQDGLDEQLERKQKEGEIKRRASDEESDISMDKPKVISQAAERPASNHGNSSKGESESERLLTDRMDQPGPEPPTSTSETPRPTSPPSLEFYLHHPSLPSKNPVLIPLPSDATLATTLTNRLVLEFPTIYVLPQHQDGGLPDGFISEDDYFAAAKTDLIEVPLEVEDTVEDINVFPGETRDGLEEGEVHEGRLLEVLGKDLRAITAAL